MPWSKDITDKSWQIKPINPADCMGLVYVGQYGTAIIRQTSLLCDINMYWKQRCRWLDSWIKTYLRDLKLIIIRTQFYFMCWKCEFPGLFTFKYCPMYLDIVCSLRISRHERRKALVPKFAVWIKINPFYDQRFLLQSAKNSVAILICRYFIMTQWRYIHHEHHFPGLPQSMLNCLFTWVKPCTFHWLISIDIAHKEVVFK